jgi:hypothetical protein
MLDYIRKLIHGPFIKVRSFRNSGEVYVCYLRETRCTCPDWKKRRSAYSKTDPQRLCKHLSSEYARLETPPTGHNPEQEDQIALCRKYRVGYPLGWMYLETQDGLMDIRQSPSDPAWFNVYHDGDQYGFNHEECRWSYGNQPPFAKEIVQVLLGLPPTLAEDAVTTVSRKRLDKWKRDVVGECEGVTFTARVNGKAKWQRGVYDQAGFALHLGTGEFEIQPRLLHMEEALASWLRAEYQQIRAEAAAEKR